MVFSLQAATTERFKTCHVQCVRDSFHVDKLNEFFSDLFFGIHKPNNDETGFHHWMN